jgi:hypothetical protein
MNNLLKADTRLNAGETGSQMVRRLYASNLTLNSVGALASSLATRLQNGVSVTQLSAGQPFVFIPYPQFSSLNVLDSNDFSTYHGLEAQVTRRLSKGVSFNLAYTWSKALDTRSFDPTLTVVGTSNASTAADTPFDINNRRSTTLQRFRPPARLPVELRGGTAVRQRQALPEQAGSAVDRVHRGEKPLGWWGMPRRTSRGQTGLAANFRQTAPEIHASLVGPLSVAASARFFMEFRGRNAHPNRPGRSGKEISSSHDRDGVGGDGARANRWVPPRGAGRLSRSF